MAVDIVAAVVSVLSLVSWQSRGGVHACMAAWLLAPWCCACMAAPTSLIQCLPLGGTSYVYILQH